MQDAKRRLLWHGALLFLLGLFTGLGEQSFSNPRMGLAAHLEGVMNGILLLVLGAVWTELKLSRALQSTAFRGVLYGTYANWLVTTIAAILGTAALSPVTAAGYAAQPWQEIIVTCGFMSVGIAMLGSLVLVLWGLRRIPVS